MSMEILIPKVEYYTRVLVGILGVAFPILFQLISKLDDKYSSTLILELFNKEKEKRWFLSSLIASLTAVTIWSFELPPLFQINGLNFIINNSADILVFLTTTVLIITFFLYIFKILIYYTPQDFIKYLIKKHNISADQELKYLKALGDVFNNSLKKENEALTETIIRFFSEEYYKKRNENKDLQMVYPDVHYKIIYKAIEELAALGNKRNLRFESMIGDHRLLLGELKKSEISENTFSAIWQNMLLCLRYKHDDMIFHYWTSAHDYYEYKLPSILPEYNSSDFTIKNQTEISKRKVERERFLEFHIALGGLLLYSKKYELLERLLNHTMSEPPFYALLPQGMTTIFKNFSKFIDPYNRQFSFISYKYPFPGKTGVNADSFVKKWISSYLSLIFLKQYTLNHYLVSDNHLGFPDSPETQAEKKFWINNLDYFLKLVNENLSNQELQKVLKYDFITPIWCTENGKLYPNVYIQQFKEKLQTDFNNKETNQTISTDKVSLFESSTKTTMENGLQFLFNFGSKNKISENFRFWRSKGNKFLQNRNSFVEDAEVQSINFDSAPAEFLMGEIKRELTSTFKSVRTKQFLFKNEDLFNAIEKLKLNEEYILVTFGILIDHYIHYVKVNHLSANKFHNTEIVSFPFNFTQENSIFILKKSDLPEIVAMETSDEIIAKYELKKISTTLNIYTSIFDFGTRQNTEVFNENAAITDNEQLLRSVLVCIFLNFEIRWKENAKVFQFSEYSEYLQQGLPNSIEDVIGIFDDPPKKQGD